MAYLNFVAWPVPVNCGDIGQDPGDVTGMLWEKAGEELPNAGDGVANWWLVAGDTIERPDEPAGDRAAAGEGCRRTESWVAVV